MAIPFFGQALIVLGATAPGSNTINVSSKILGTPQLPSCRAQLGPPKDEHNIMDHDSCRRAIAKIPREPRSTPALLNFYIDAKDRSRTMVNVKIPATWSDGKSRPPQKQSDFPSEPFLRSLSDCIHHRHRSVHSYHAKGISYVMKSEISRIIYGSLLEAWLFCLSAIGRLPC